MHFARAWSMHLHPLFRSHCCLLLRYVHNIQSGPIWHLSKAVLIIPQTWKFTSPPPFFLTNVPSETRLSVLELESAWCYCLLSHRSCFNLIGHLCISHNAPCFWPYNCTNSICQMVTESKNLYIGLDRDALWMMDKRSITISHSFSV